MTTVRALQRVPERRRGGDALLSILCIVSSSVSQSCNDTFGWLMASTYQVIYVCIPAC
jgi:hypothetical protein